MVAKFRPSARIVAVTPNVATYRSLSLVWGVRPLLVAPVSGTDDMVTESLRAAKETRLVKENHRVVITAGVPVGVPGNTNLILVRTA